jgi:TetR/AcrR family transcriptional regulator, cholesterol catabolism regulator
MSEELSRRHAPGSAVLDRLLDATVTELRESGYGGLTVRLVARRAGVSAATAYNYVSSKEHLLASLFWRQLAALARPADLEGATAALRVEHLVGGIVDMVLAEPELLAAYRVALLADDPDATRIRDAMAVHLSGEFAWALGEELSESARVSIELAFVGGLVLAGSALMPPDAVVRQIADLVKQLR